MENCSAEIIDNIKQEPERHFLVVLPNYQDASDDSDETTEQINSISKLKINVEKFNENWKKTDVKLFDTCFVCRKCDHVAKTSVNLNKHLKICKGKENKCSFCDQKFTRNDKEKHENQEHRKGSNWLCNQCPYKTLGRMNLRNHYVKIHPKKHSCETCAKKFAKPSLLRNHQMQNRHGIFVTKKVSKLECKECGKTFATKLRLYEHKYSVHSQKSFHCDYCGKTFKTKDLVKVHMNVHFKIPCSVCGKPFAENQRRNHMKQFHSSGKTVLACRIASCQQKFSFAKQQNEHQSIHIGSQRYKCPTCSYEAKHFQRINSHMSRKSHSLNLSE